MLGEGVKTHMVAKHLAAAVDRVSADREDSQAFSVQDQLTESKLFLDVLRSVRLRKTGDTLV